MNKNRLVLLINIMFRGTIGTFKSAIVSTGSRSITIVAFSSIIVFGLALFSQLILLYYKIGDISGGILLLEVSATIILTLLILVTIPILLSNMYQNSDTFMYASLPFTQKEIAAARLIICYLRILPFSLILGLPAIVIGIITNTLSLLQVLVFLILIFVLPLVLICIIGILLFIFLIFEILSPWNGLLTAIFSIIAYVLVFVGIASIQMAIVPAIINNNQNLTIIIKKLLDIVNSLYDTFPFNAIADIFKDNLLVLIPLVVLLISLLAIGYILVVLYSTGYTSVDKLLLYTKDYSQGRVLSSVSINRWLFRKEYWALREKSFFIYSVILGVLIPPISLGITCYFMMSFLKSNGYNYILQSVYSFKYIELVTLIIVLTMAVANTVLATSVSRDGKYFYISKMLPISYRYQYQAKIIFGVILSSISLIFSIFIIIFIKIPIHSIICFILTSFTFIIATNIASNIFDLKNPKINWTHPQQAINENRNAIVFIVWILIILLIFSVIMGLLAIKLSIITSYIVMILLLIIVSLVIYNRIISKLEKYYNKIDI